MSKILCGMYNPPSHHLQRTIVTLGYSIPSSFTANDDDVYLHFYSRQLLPHLVCVPLQIHVLDAILVSHNFPVHNSYIYHNLPQSWVMQVVRCWRTLFKGQIVCQRCVGDQQ